MASVPFGFSADDTSTVQLGSQAVQAGSLETAGALRQRLRQMGWSDWDLVCVSDEAQHLLGVLTPPQLLTLADETTLGDAAVRDWPQVPPGTGEERVASLALHHHVPAMLVVDEAGRLVDVVGTLTLMNTLRREHVEDLHRLAGITRESRHARQAMEEPPLRRARHRLPWLMVGLAGSMLATLVVARFEAVLAAKPAIAFFVPGLVYLADAIGTQSEAVAVRGLSLSHSGLGRLLGGELRTGTLIGLVLALLAFPFIWLTFGEFELALAVTLALACASVMASMLGLLLPWLLGRLGYDPALGSGPLCTIVQDVLSLLIYFSLISVIVRPTL